MRVAIAEYETKIRVERENLNRDVKAEQQFIHEQIESVEEESSKLTMQQATARRRAEDIDDMTRDKVDRLSELKEAIRNAGKDIDQHKSRIASINRTKGNSLLRFGDKMPQLINAINKAQWVQRPIGPIGAFIQLKDQDYAPVIESLFNHFLNAIICKDKSDLNKMQLLARSVGW